MSWIDGFHAVLKEVHGIPERAVITEVTDGNFEQGCYTCSDGGYVVYIHYTLDGERHRESFDGTFHEFFQTLSGLDS